MHLFDILQFHVLAYPIYDYYWYCLLRLCAWTFKVQIVRFIMHYSNGHCSQCCTRCRKQASLVSKSLKATWYRRYRSVTVNIPHHIPIWCRKVVSDNTLAVQQWIFTSLPVVTVIFFHFDTFWSLNISFENMFILEACL